MPRRRCRSKVIARKAAALAPALAAVLAGTACRAPQEPAPRAERPALGLMTTLPLIWGEAEDVGELLRDSQGEGWVREELERGHRIEPLDTLDEGALARLDRLVLAQPRPLAPAENVALDAWVRGGGRLLLFADPMLTQHSRYALGDRRRPLDTVLLSPILSHWGLDLLFDEGQPAGERIVEIEGLALPVEMAGRFEPAIGARCAVRGHGVLVRCRIGKGEVLAVADAEVLDDAEKGAAPALRREALARLVALAFE